MPEKCLDDIAQETEDVHYGKHAGQPITSGLLPHLNLDYTALFQGQRRLRGIPWPRGAVDKEQVRRTVSIRDGRTSTETFRRTEKTEEGDHRIIAEEFAVLDRAGRLQLPRAHVVGLEVDEGALHLAAPSPAFPMISTSTLATNGEKRISKRTN